ncbi:MAG TPA: nucleoside diphosphate kinase regulator [Sphingomonas sp.]|nr:nucleoside diphosphate kinase regulator [Sphingomonas sp.]
MTTSATTASTTRPPLHLLESEADALSDLALRIARSQPEVSALLLGEIDRAELHRPDDLPPRVVTMNATVEFVDEASGVRRTVQLVYPGDADIGAGRISVLTPVGAGLIGLAEGASIVWPDREGHDRVLRIVSIERAEPR